jgi:hypothetical protein
LVIVEMEIAGLFFGLVVEPSDIYSATGSVPVDAYSPGSGA